MNRNKEKGKAFERAVANHLTDVFNLSFTRTPNSGAYVGGLNAFRMKSLSDSQILLTEGDIIVPDELHQLKIECKSYKSLSFHQLFTKCKQLDTHGLIKRLVMKKFGFSFLKSIDVVHLYVSVMNITQILIQLETFYIMKTK